MVVYQRLRTQKARHRYQKIAFGLQTKFGVLHSQIHYPKMSSKSQKEKVALKMTWSFHR